MVHSGLNVMSLEEIIHEAIKRELSLLLYYRTALRCVGPDAYKAFADSCACHEQRIAMLEELLISTEDMRQITESMAD